jgi:peptidoglycan/xylan/chitin deacetylase (PgdA/CDA1 family)
LVLAFHRVLDEDTLRVTSSEPGMIVREQTFDAVAGHVVRQYRAVDVLSAEPGGHSDRLRFAFTFDDGWLDNKTTMLPLAKKRFIPVTVFVSTGTRGAVAPFRPEEVAASESRASANRRAAAPAVASDQPKSAVQPGMGGALSVGMEQELPEPKEDGTLTWDDVRLMWQAGVRFGAHTRTHPFLPAMTRESVLEEVAGSKEDMERALNAPCEGFAYPYGKSTREVRQCVLEAGFRLAFTLDRGAWTEACDRLSIPRMNMSEGNFVGLSGRFSPTMFDYTVVWRTWRASVVRARREARVRATGVEGLGA